MIYIDTSVVLAELLVEDRKPKASLWSQPLVSSRLLQYETWSRVNAAGLTGSHGERTRGWRCIRASTGRRRRWRGL